MPTHRTVWAIPLSVLAHTGLLLALVASVAWKNEPVPASTMQAELWELTPSSKPVAVPPVAAAAAVPALEPAPKTPVAPSQSNNEPAVKAAIKPAAKAALEPDAIAPTLLKKPLKTTAAAPEPVKKPVVKKAAPLPKIKPQTPPPPSPPAKPKAPTEPVPTPDTSAADAARRREIIRLNQLSQNASPNSAAPSTLSAPSPAPRAPAAPTAPPTPSAPSTLNTTSSPQPSGAPNVGAPQMGSSNNLGAGWGAKLKACVQPNLRYSSTGSDNLRAVFVIQLSTEGAPSDPVLSRSSGNTAFDAAVSRALLRCDPFPKPESGGYPPSVTVAYRLND